MFGGSIKYNGKTVTFQNTCPVDTWFAVFKALLLKNTSLICTIKDETLKRLLLFLEKGAYNAAKLQVALLNKVTPKNNVLNFFGAEYEVVLKSLVAPFMVHKDRSSCDSPHCSKFILPSHLFHKRI